MTKEILVRDALLGISAFTVGMCISMAWRHIAMIYRRRKIWDLWFLLIWAGIANTVGLVSQLIWSAPQIDLTFKSISFGLGVLGIGIGAVGVARSTGRRDKRSTDRPGPSGVLGIGIGASGKRSTDRPGPSDRTEGG